MSSIAEENVFGDPIGVFFSQEGLGSGKMISRARRKAKEKGDGEALHVGGRFIRPHFLNDQTFLGVHSS